MADQRARPSRSFAVDFHGDDSNVGIPYASVALVILLLGLAAVTDGVYAMNGDTVSGHSLINQTPINSLKIYNLVRTW